MNVEVCMCELSRRHLTIGKHVWTTASPRPQNFRRVSLPALPMTPSTEQIVEVINKDTSPSTSESTDLGNDPSEVSVSRELSAGSVLGRVPKEEPCGERSQSLCFVHRFSTTID